jgi:hypothetical protein
LLLVLGNDWPTTLSALVQALASEDTEDLAQYALIVAFFVQVIYLNVIEGVAWIGTWLLIPVGGRALFLSRLWLLQRP